MQSRYVLYAIILVAVFTMGALCGDMFRTPALAQEDGDNAEAEETTDRPKYSLEKAPVVAAEPYEYETEYEMDPFEPDKIRSTTTRVHKLVIVRADGTKEIVNAK